jgi:hypothetical protein
MENQKRETGSQKLSFLDGLDWEIMEKFWGKPDENNRITWNLSKSTADRILNGAYERLAIILKKANLSGVLLTFPGATTGYEIEPLEDEDTDSVNDEACRDLVLSIAGASGESERRVQEVDFSGLGLGNTYLRDANYLKIEEFIGEMRQRGYIVTITDMVSNRCLKVNDLQVQDRGGGWTGANWAGLNFLNLWKDSFLAGNHNYFGELIELVGSEWFIPNFEYLLRAPNGDLRRYWSFYFYALDYLGTPVRICVSVPGNWDVVEVVA